MLFGIAGPTASGKTTVTDFLVTKYDAPSLRYSEVLSEIASERGLDPTDKATLQDLYLSEKESRGERWLAEEIVARVTKLNTQHLVIEGNRLKGDLETLEAVAEARGEEWVLIFIDASPETRYERYNTRLAKQNKSSVTWEAFMVLENKATEAEVKDLRAHARESGIYIDTDEHDIASTLELVQSALKTKGR